MQGLIWAVEFETLPKVPTKDDDGFARNGGGEVGGVGYFRHGMYVKKGRERERERESV